MENKNLLFYIVFLVNFSIVSAQQNFISLNNGYENQSFFSMENGEVLNVPNDDWDIAFSTDVFSSTIRINDGKGVELYVYPLGDTSSWNNINSSTPNILNQPMYNSDTSWDIGAFDINSSGGFDYGWGVYNLQTHHIVGDSLFLLKTINGVWKKLWIERKISGEIFFQHADLDGTNLINQSVDASNYNNKRFIYYSLADDLVIDREPLMTEWDITFTKYITPVMGTPYGVTGVLSNKGIEVSQANVNDPFNYVDYTSHNFNHEINSIGYDWKSYQSGGYVIDNNRCYFIRDYNNKIWRIIFTSFDGISTGNIEFNTLLIDATSNIFNESLISTFTLYPNPANNNVLLIYDLEEDLNQIFISDINGKKVKDYQLSKQDSLSKLEINISELNKGIYIVSLHNKIGKLIANEKLVIY